MLLWMGTAWAGGGPQNVMVLYNIDVGAAGDVAAYYAEARDLPPGHLCGISGIAETETDLSLEDYKTWVLAPLDDCLAALPQPEDIDYLVVVRGLPYRVEAGGYTVSLSAALQVYRTPSPEDSSRLLIDDGHPDGYAYVYNPYYKIGNKADFDLESPYAVWYTSASAISNASAQPTPFERETAPPGFGENLFIVTRLDGFDFQDAYDVVDRGVAADGSFPAADFLCMDGADSARGARDPECEYAIRRLQSLGRSATWVSPFDGGLSGHEVIAYFTGAADVRGGIDGLTYAPGAITCNLTSYGAVPNNFFCDETGETCPERESQTSMARFIRAGATGAHGTVNEPYNNVFPNAGAMMLYGLGYSLGESYFNNQLFLYWQNLYIGDPLATPYQERPEVAVAEKTTPVNVPITASATHPDGIQQMRLYADDVLVAEEEGDLLSWTPSGYAAGRTLELRVVAEAADVSQEVTGWDQQLILVRSRTQGWSLSTLALTDAVDLPSDTGDSGEPEDDDSGGGGEGNDTPEDCGCASSSGALGGVWALALVALVGRRRQP